MSRDRFLKMEGLAPLGCDGGIDALFYKDKDEIFKHLILRTMAQTIKMFEYKDLPETLDARTLELSMQRDGFVLVTYVTNNLIREHAPASTDYKELMEKLGEEYKEVKEKDIKWIKPKEGLYAFLGSAQGGVLDQNYLPTLGIFTNPYLLNASLRLEIGKECVRGWNDSMQEGLSPVNGLYAGMLTEALVTLRCRLILERAPHAITASSEDEKNEAIKYLKDLEKGELGVLASKSTLANILGTENSGLRTNPLGSDQKQSLKELLEAIQYISAQWNIKLGLNDNYNMKREALNSTETEANSDTLYPIIEDMLACRKKMVEEINAMFGTKISVSLAGQWKRLVDTEDIRMEYLEKTAEEIGEQDAPKVDEPQAPEETPKEEEKPEEVAQ